MQIFSKEIVQLITVITLIFLIAPISIIVYVSLYNRKQAKHLEEKELLRKNFELELLKSQFEVQEHTLEAVATDLHDNIGQLLSLTSITLSAIKSGNIHEDKINTAGELVHRTIQEVRQLSRIISARELLTKDLPHAINYELEWLRKASDYEITFIDNSGNVISGNAEKELMLFRLFQEILSNIIKHADATKIKITVNQNDGVLSLHVKDNGKGFALDEMVQANRGLGLSNISKRAKLMNGTFTINSIPGLGTDILISIPYI